MGHQTNIAAKLRARGLRVREVGGWTTRGSSSFYPRGVVCHWTAGPRGAAAGTTPCLNVVTYGRAGLPGPLCNVYLARDGVAYVVAAGRANHAGLGGTRGMSGNSSVFGIEAECGGDGDWTAAMREAYPKVCAGLLDSIGSKDSSKVVGHNEWAPTRKIDIRDYTMSRMRSDVAKVLSGKPVKAWKGKMGWPELRSGDSGGDVKELQRELRKRDYNIGNAGVDGQFGPSTEKAVKAFQRDAKLGADGIVGTNTQKALAQKDWFDMATEKDLRNAIRDYIESYEGRKAISKAVWHTDTVAAPSDTDTKKNPNWMGRSWLNSIRNQARKAERVSAANGAAVEALAKAQGVDPADIRKIVSDAVDKSLADVSITLSNEEG